MVQNRPTATDTAPFWTSFLPSAYKDGVSALPDMQKLMMMGPHMQAAMMKAMIDQQREMFGFLQKRCDEDMKFAEKIGSATCMTDIVTASLHFCKVMATQYAAQASEAAEISSQGTIEVAHDLQRERAGILAAREQKAAA